MVEYQLPKLGVAGSIPVARFFYSSHEGTKAQSRGTSRRGDPLNSNLRDFVS